jgi:voltage-gated potassium channel
MDSRVLMRFRGKLRHHFQARRHTALLVVIVILFALRPLIGDTEVAVAAVALSMVGLLVLALYTIQIDELVGERKVLLAQRRRSLVAWTLAVLAVAERLATIVAPSPQLYLLGSACWLLFFAYVTWSLLRSLLKHKDVTGETISMSISIYLLIGLTWGLLYAVIFERHPAAFSFGGSPAPTEARHNIFPILIYFSLTTLSTIGFGDITPMTLPARYAAVAEGITGQFYLAILVARLVGMQMSRSASHDSSNHR